MHNSSIFTYKVSKVRHKRHWTSVLADKARRVYGLCASATKRICIPLWTFPANSHTLAVLCCLSCRLSAALMTEHTQTADVQREREVKRGIKREWEREEKRERERERERGALIVTNLFRRIQRRCPRDRCLPPSVCDWCVLEWNSFVHHIYIRATVIFTCSYGLFARASYLFPNFFFCLSFGQFFSLRLGECATRDLHLNRRDALNAWPSFGR